MRTTKQRVIEAIKRSKEVAKEEREYIVKLYSSLETMTPEHKQAVYDCYEHATKYAYLVGALYDIFNIRNN